MACSKCKKPKEVELVKPKTVIESESVYTTLYTEQELKEAYYELTSMGGVKEEKKQLITDVYQTLFGEKFDFGCQPCVSRQARRFSNYLKEKYNINV